MNIIDEIRSIATYCDSGGWSGISVELNSIADRLAASGALVPVPQYRCGYEQWDYNADSLKLHNDVALVPITEAEI